MTPRIAGRSQIALLGMDPLDFILDIDEVLSRFAVALVNRVAGRARVSAHHVALVVPGLCHTHLPDARLVEGCAYCRRRGNVFAAGGDE